MNEDLEKTVSIYNEKPKKDYKIIICKKNKHEVISLSDFKKKEITFGRAKDNDIVISSNLVSAHHGKFLYDAALAIVDNNSTNGLFINGELEKEYVLSDGDVVKIDNPDRTLDECVAISVALNTVPDKCPNCNKNVDDSKNVEEKEEVKPAKKESSTFCGNCGAEIKSGVAFCPGCGAPTKKEKVVNNVVEPQMNNTYNQIPPMNTANPNKKTNLVPLFIVLGVIGFLFITGIIIGAVVISNKKKVDSYPPRVNISMTSYYGYIDYILDEFDLDFDEVTMGGNCYSGTISQTFHTVKYGTLHTEYRYCKSNETLVFRLYNSEQDQPLRDPNPGEVPEFDSKGYKVSSKYGYV